MSYCRFTDDSDVYAYECDGGVQFWVAGRENRHLDRLCNTFNEAYQYAKALRDEHGLEVPPYAIEALKADAIDEAERFTGPHGAVAEHIRDLEALVRDLWHGFECGAGCVHFDWCSAMVDDSECMIEQRMRALGIGVDK